MTKIACVGITVQDRIYSLLTLPDGGGKYQANHYLEIGGARQQQPLLQSQSLA